MKLLRGLEGGEAREARNVVMTLGAYDGVHLGHRRVIERVTREAKRLGGSSLLVTFDPHPRQVLKKETSPPMLTTLRQKIRLLSEMGLDFCVALPFTPQLAEEEAAEFVVRHLLASLDLRGICVGPEFAFGRGRSGDTKLLERLGLEHGFSVKVVEGVRVGGVYVRSTAIREMISRGDLKTASLLLGRPFSLAGSVIRGKALGRELGIPTANLHAEGVMLPPPGVYAVWAVREGRVHGGACNIDRHRHVEVHIFDFRDDIYGEELEVFFSGLIRDERDFPCRSEMIAQIRSDIEIAKGMLHNGDFEKRRRVAETSNR